MTKVTTKTYWVRLPSKVARVLKARATAQHLSRAAYMAQVLEREATTSTSEASK